MQVEGSVWMSPSTSHRAPRAAVTNSRTDPDMATSKRVTTMTVSPATRLVKSLCAATFSWTSSNTRAKAPCDPSWVFWRLS
jgi:hypothetical protein